VALKYVAVTLYCYSLDIHGDRDVQLHPDKVHTVAIRLTAGGGVIMESVRSQNIETTQIMFS